MIKKVLVLLVVLILLTLIVVPVFYTDERHELDAHIRAGTQGDYVELSQGVTHYQQANKDAQEVVLLVHGFSVPYYIWDPTYEFLKNQGFRVIRFDLYGRGYSDRPNVDYDQTMFDRQILDLLETLKIRQSITIIGLSMGGAIVAKFVADHPEKVNKTVFVDPSHRSFYKRKLDIPLVGDFIAATVMMPKAAEDQLSDFYYPENFPDWVEKYKEQMQYKGFRRAIVSTLLHFAKPDKLPWYQRIGSLGKDVLLIWGREDQTLPLADSQRVAVALKTTTFVVDQSGHLPHLEHPEIVNAKILGFLKQN
jgi:pimeloyl-ACP methyl ester carboxylesterase